VADQTLHAKLLEEARNYDPSEHSRMLLAPLRDVVLIWRAKYMSYEQISAALERNGIRVSAGSVGVYCRRTYTRAEIQRERVRLQVGSRSSLPAAGRAGVVEGNTERKGPRVARDEY
jgi:hypothetical protein